jgi:CheY-like chemotaxis protein
VDDTALRILVVDDYQDCADSLAMLLEASGHVVKTAYDGASAIVLAHDFKPDIVLLDIVMPEMDGYEVARRLLSRLPDSRMHLIAVTGYGQRHDMISAYEAGFDCHLLKPVDAMTLRAVLARFIAALRERVDDAGFSSSRTSR